MGDQQHPKGAVDLVNGGTTPPRNPQLRCGWGNYDVCARGHHIHSIPEVENLQQLHLHHNHLQHLFHPDWDSIPLAAAADSAVADFAAAALADFVAVGPFHLCLFLHSSFLLLLPSGPEQPMRA